MEEKQVGEGVFKQKIEKIMGKLGDEESKKIFEARLLYSLAGNSDYFESEVLGLQKIAYEKPVAIFGCGVFGQLLKKYIENTVCFIDNYAHKSRLINGLPVFSLDDFIREFNNVDIIIGSVDYYDEIKDQLNKLNISTSDFPVCFTNLLNKIKGKTQYFDLQYLQHNEHEVFVDGGCLDGSTSLDFIKWSKSSNVNKRTEVIMFEPNKYQIPVCEKALSLKDVPFKIIPKGLSDCVQTLRFNSARNNPKAAAISDEGDIVIETVRMDDVLKDQRITYVKLDIEGAELKALRGMVDIICSQRPKLAISVYHKHEDIWEIPLQIIELNENYRLYLRHYSWNNSETVLYAV